MSRVNVYVAGGVVQSVTTDDRSISVMTFVADDESDDEWEIAAEDYFYMPNDVALFRSRVAKGDMSR